MKTVGTVTFHVTFNYGANLQAYALQQTLTSMGLDNEIIDYRNSDVGRPVLSPYRKIRHFVWSKVAKLLAGTTRKRRTESFWSNYLCFSPCQYVDSDSLHRDPPIYDFYVTGSDQVWNPLINGCDSSCFLSFAPKGKKRISYAASFGVSQLDAKYSVNYRKWINEIDALSTREQAGKQIIHDLTGRHAVVTLDPTLLLTQNEWSKIAIPYNSLDKYILCYYMPGDDVVNKSITAIARRVSLLTGWRIICIGQKEYNRLNPFKNSVFNAGPAEFLGMFQNASFVVTNSFHGTAFSINYQKPFFVPINNNLLPEKALSSRVVTLLEFLRLEHRILDVNKKDFGDIELDLDFKPIERLLNIERLRSFEFLKDAFAERED